MGVDFPLVVYIDIKSDEIFEISNISVTCASFSLVMLMPMKILIKSNGYKHKQQLDVSSIIVMLF